MEPLIAGVLVTGLYKAVERSVELVRDKALDAAWEALDEELKGRLRRWAGKDQESERWRAFQDAAARAMELTVSQASDPEQARTVLKTLHDVQDERAVAALAQELTHLLFSAEPDLERLTALVRDKLRLETLVEDVAAVLPLYLLNLREALLDQPPYADLLSRETLRVLRLDYDDEERYRAQLIAYHQELDFVGLPEIKERRAVTVEEIFVRLRTRSQAPRELLQLPDETSIPPQALDSLENVAPIVVDAGRIAARHARTVILGDPGAGKTTLLKYLALISADHRAESLGLPANTLPLFIRLRDFATAQSQSADVYSLLDYFYHHAHEHLQLNMPPGFFQDVLRAGRCLVCLDGLDEVWTARERGKVRDQVEILANCYPQNRYLVTSRIVAYEQAPLNSRAFQHYTVLPLEDKDIQRFVERWYQAREPDAVYRAHKIRDLLDTLTDESRIRDLARNPLLLTIIALVHRSEAKLPHERVKLYDKCVTALVDTWEKVKGLTIEEKTRPFYRQRRRLLERLAYELHARANQPGRRAIIKRGDLELTLARFLLDSEGLALEADPETARDEAQAFIRIACGRTGLLLERGQGVFGFPHLTFEEYLAACDIQRRLVDQGVEALWEAIKDRLHDGHWREVILLLLGSLDEEFTTLVQHILDLGQDDKFEPVLHRHTLLAAHALADRLEVDVSLQRQIVDDLLELAREGRAWEQEDAIDALTALAGDAGVVAGLLTLARDTDVESWVRRAAARAIGPRDRADEALDTLVMRDEGRDARVHSQAASILGELGRVDEAADILLPLASAEETEAWVRCDVARVLGQLGRIDEATHILLDLAYDMRAEAWVRSEAARTLMQLGCTDKAADILLALARDDQVEAWVRSEASTSLGQLGYVDQAAETLLALARDEQVNAWVRGDAARALKQLGRAEEATNLLLTLVHADEMDGWVHGDAVQALRELSDRTIRTGDVLLDLVRDEAPGILLALIREDGMFAWVRSEAASALGQLSHPDEQILNGLLAVARDAKVEPWVRNETIAALGALGCTDERVLDDLLVLASDEGVDPIVRNAAARALKILLGSARYALGDNG